MKEGLVIVHACDQLVERISDTFEFQHAITERVISYLNKDIPLFYTPFTVSQKDFPSFLWAYRHRINTILVNYPKSKREGFAYQATVLSEVLKTQGIQSVEVGGLYYHACVNVTCKVLESSGLLVERNKEICR